MTRTSILLLLSAGLVAGCGGSSSGPAATAAAPVTSGTTTTPLVGVHGELVSAPALGGGDALAFLADGAALPLEVVDPSGLLAAGVHEGFTLVVDGEASANAGGRTALAGALRVTSFAADDLVVTGRLLPGFPGVALQVERETYQPDGPLAAALLASPLDRPVFVTGRLAGGVTQVGPLLEVTSWRPAVTLAWSHMTPLLGAESFAIDDVEGTGAYRTASTFARGPAYASRRGAGRRLDAAALGDVRARLAAADLRAQPPVLRPRQIYPDHPTTTLRLEDAAGAVSILIYAGAALPPELDALVQRLQGLPATVPTVRGIEQGTLSLIVQAGAEAARDDVAWQALWSRHVGGRAVPPGVDFTHEVAVGVFDGVRPSDGYAIEVEDVLRIGRHLHLQVRRTSPSGPAGRVLTAPYHFVAVDQVGGAGDLYAEGARLP